MGYRQCPECGSQESGGTVWVCNSCGHKGHSTGTFFGGGCWSGSGGCPICGKSNYSSIGYID